MAILAHDGTFICPGCYIQLSGPWERHCTENIPNVDARSNSYTESLWHGGFKKDLMAISHTPQSEVKAELKKRVIQNDFQDNFASRNSKGRQYFERIKAST